MKASRIMDNVASPLIHATCSAEAFDEAMKLIGDFWTLHIIDALRSQELRFCEIERALLSSNPATLTNRLRRLEEAGVVNRLEETRDKQSVTYELSEKGKGILPILDSIKTFTEAYLK